MQVIGLAVVLLALLPAPQARLVPGVVLDEQDRPVAGARVRLLTRGRGVVEVQTGADGAFEIPVPAGVTARIEVRAPAFATAALDIEPGTPEPLRVRLAPRGLVETVTVTANPGRLRVTMPASVTALDAADLASSPALTLDDQLRSVPGFSLFRRSSSRVANPTTQGVTLRGFAASGASRSAVFADGVALNDPFGGWVYWNRVPAAAIDRVEVARGGTSDLFGSDAMGGAIRIVTARGAGARVWFDGGSRGSARISAFGGHAGETWSGTAAVEASTSDGFTIVARESRGAIDVPAWSEYVTAHAAARLQRDAASFGLRAGYFTEDRGNGTPFQTNATIIRYGAASAAGSAWGGAWNARGGGGSQGYDQTFSAIAADRASERPTTLQHVDAQWAEGALEWVRTASAWALLLAGSIRLVDADLREAAAAAPLDPTFIRARQRSGAATAQLSWQPSARLTLGAGARGEVWSSSLEDESGGESRSRIVPRASAAWQLSDHVSIRGTAHAAFRAPTINELYRPFRVGNVLTRANAALDPETSAGVEGAAIVRRGAAAVRLTAFWTRLDDAIVNVTLESSPQLIVRQRQNAGVIRARGLEVETDARLRVLSVTASAAWIDSTFTEGLGLAGLRVPQVPRVQAAAGLRAAWPSASASIDWRYAGDQFDDDRNQFRLEGSGLVHARAGWRPRRSLELFAAIENVLDQDQDVGRTPLRTIGTPRTMWAGVRWVK